MSSLFVVTLPRAAFLSESRGGNGAERVGQIQGVWEQWEQWDDWYQKLKAALLSIYDYISVEGW